MSSVFYQGLLPDKRRVEVEVRGSRIYRVHNLPDEIHATRLSYFLPVLVDLQHNGALGAYYGDIPRLGLAKLREIAAFLRKNGVGRCLLTLVTQRRSELDLVADYLGKILDADSDLAQLFFGIFHEGVFVSHREGWRGAHARAWIEHPNWSRLRELDDRTGGRIRLVNVAPEEPGGLKFIEQAVAAGKMVALGHCCPSDEVVNAAISSGASMVTHFGNGAASKIHRFENPFWTFLDREELTLGLICDGFHLPASIVRTAMKCKGRAKCLPVSDASGCSGLASGVYDIVGGRSVQITPSGCVHLVSNAEILAGGWFQQNRSVEFLVREAGFTFLDAWDQCSRIPAKAVGLVLPEIKEGEEASFVLAQWDDGVVIEQAIHGGIAASCTGRISKLDHEAQQSAILLQPQEIKV